jgi:hypothetical protein
MTTTVIRDSKELETLLAAERELRCETCDQQLDRDRGNKLLEKLGRWWLAPDTQEAIGAELAIRTHDKTPKLQNIGVVFFASLPNENTEIPVVLYEIQHEYPGKSKPGMHYQLQIPHGDVGKNLTDKTKRQAVNRAWNRHDRKMDVYRPTKPGSASGEKLKSIRHAKALANLAEIQAAVIALAEDLIEAFGTHDKEDEKAS